MSFVVYSRCPLCRTGLRVDVDSRHKGGSYPSIGAVRNGSAAVLNPTGLGAAIVGIPAILPGHEACLEQLGDIGAEGIMYGGYTAATILAVAYRHGRFHKEFAGWGQGTALGLDMGITGTPAIFIADAMRSRNMEGFTDSSRRRYQGSSLLGVKTDESCLIFWEGRTTGRARIEFANGRDPVMHESMPTGGVFNSRMLEALTGWRD
jgi:hypothetical protein